MGVSNLMSLAMRTMTAQQAALQATGHNIANANVAGYSRQQAELATATGQFTGAGFFGKGVDVQTISRMHNAFLTAEASNTRSAAGQDEARLNQLQYLERVFPLGERGLGNAAMQLFNAFGDLASRPDDIASRQVVMARAAELATRFTNAQQQLDVQQKGVTEDMVMTVKSVNALTAGIADLNYKISTLQGAGQPPNDLLDERDRLVAQLSDHLQVTTLMAEDGSMSVFAAGGQRLVLGREAQELAVVADDRDSSRSALAVLDNGTARRLSSNSFSGGRLAGLLSFQNKDLVDARNSIGQLAAAIAGAVNAQHQLGTDLDGVAGAAAFFSVPAPRVLAAAGNSAGGTAVTVGPAIGWSELQASDYDVRADPAGPAGAWMVTRLSDDKVFNVAPPDNFLVVDGMRIEVANPALLNADRFLVQPVSQSGLMKFELTDPRGIAAESAPSSNGNALAMAALRDTRLVGMTRDSGGALTGGATTTDAYAAAMGDVGVRVQTAQALSSVSQAMATYAEGSRSSVAGVNLDEEAARLIEFQQSYQAAAKVLQVAQSLFDTLLQASAR